MSEVASFLWTFRLMVDVAVGTLIVCMGIFTALYRSGHVAEDIKSGWSATATAAINLFWVGAWILWALAYITSLIGAA